LSAATGQPPSLIAMSQLATQVKPPQNVNPAPPGLDDFAVLVERHYQQLFATAFSLIADATAVEDIVQEALLTAMRIRERFTPGADLGAWVRGIIRMKCLEWRRQQRLPLIDAQELTEVEACHQQWQDGSELMEERGQVLHRLEHCLQQLSQTLHSSIEAFYRRQHSIARIADDSKSSQAAVKKRLQRGRQLLGDCMQGLSKQADEA